MLTVPSITGNLCCRHVVPWFCGLNDKRKDLSGPCSEVDLECEPPETIQGATT